MDTEKLKQLIESEFESRLEGSATRVKNRDSFKAPKDFAIRILSERENQRDIVFKFSMTSSRATLCFLIGLITLQVLYRILVDNNGTLLNGYELEIFSVGVFGQVIGLIYIIAKRLWDDSVYKDHLGKKHGDIK